MKEWTYDNPQKRSAAWEYLYLVIKDRTLEYPDGFVLIGNHPVTDMRECHDRILNRYKFFKDFAIKDPAEKQKLLEDGYRPLYPTDLIEVGSIRFEKDGTRYFQSRTGWDWDNKAGKQPHRKVKKLIFSVLKKRQKVKLEWVASKLESKKLPDETTFIAFAPQDKTIQEPEIFLLPKDQTITGFIQEKQLEPWRVLSVGTLKADFKNTGQIEISASYALAPYEHTKHANETLAVKKLIEKTKASASKLAAYAVTR